ncbi:NVEALA domain-containing protein [uncultured Parabacteroides sp.]|uniref:NVEALA domain-containing protein n=1 Tax=Parabacteroides sp. ASD2025 TaxID=3415987 RepID=UPI00265B310F|nr:NVEALA domain-containing protein [uncultured Parabacteroides sp.]
MGKKIFGVIAFGVIAAAAGWNYQQNKQEVELSDLALENVEALAQQAEGGNGEHHRAYTYNSVLNKNICLGPGSAC